VAGIEVGNVDVDRDTGQRNLVRGNVKDFVPVDYDADGDIDLAILVDEPTGFMVTFTQGAPGTFTVFSGTDDNAGIRLGSNGLDRGETYAGVRVADANGDGLYNEVALLNLTFERIEQLSIREGTTAQNGAVFVSALSTNVGDPGYSDTQYGFDLYPIPTGSVYGFGVNNTNLIQGGLASTSFGYSEFNEYQVVIAAGDGGSSLIGKGGVGGSLGGGLTGAVPDPLDPNAVDPTGTLTITFSPTIAFTGISTFVSGNGGNGFTTGGKGGSVTGLSVRDSGASNDDVVRVLAGNGGFGVSGAGGAGGDIKENSIQRAIEIVAGNGGSGKTGGDGGSVVGNGIRKAYDAESPSLEIVAGAGGDGVKRGGLGGSITNYVYRLTVLITGAVTGPLSLIAGAGGSAISGRGGNGGSINNSSPMDDDNGLAAEMFLQAGDGGNGVAGGHGGSITNFVNRPTTPDVPTIVSFIAGHGGSGTSGKGGNGGNLTNVSTPSTGDPSSLLGEQITDFTYNRYLAGNGGGSSSNTGGKGGNVSGLNVSASSGAMAVIAGAGGEGLLAGGSGGSVLNSVVSSGGPEAGGKVLVIAGAGGHATAFTENSNDDGNLNNGAKAFGGKIGKGGNGGSIVGFIQENSIDVSVDLIAGNGGDTLNYGTRRDSKTFVGQGGSIKNINLNGSVGTVDPTRAIKAYNDTDGDGINDKTLAEWVQDYIRVPVDDDGNPILPTGIGDGVGNVGIVAGAAGRIKAIAVEGGGFETQPAPGSGKLTGTVQNLTARLLMSAIAGDVNSIAAIHVAKNITILSGLVGADKGVFGTVEYYDLDDNIVSTPVLGGRLLDGAFISDNRVPEIDGKPRVFVL